jgi:U6 snRNA-associated Sm-like protein LSm6
MAEAAGTGSGGAARKTPGEFVRASLVGRPVAVKLSDGTEYRGVLVCLDGFMNVALEQADEFASSGSLKSKLGDCFIRGNNGPCGGPRRRRRRPPLSARRVGPPLRVIIAF